VDAAACRDNPPGKRAAAFRANVMECMYGWPHFELANMLSIFRISPMLIHGKGLFNIFIVLMISGMPGIAVFFTLKSIFNDFKAG
jgi:hypothetical protein